MATIHLIQQGKGGVGKSLIASFLYQVLTNNQIKVVAFDTDPENATLAGYKEYDVTRLDIMDGDNINPRQFDTLMESLVALAPDAHAIVDNGASSFYALGSYLRENKVLQLLQEEEGHRVYLHTVITGGQASIDTLSGLKRLCDNFPEIPKVVWLNPYFGDITADGKGFEDFKIYKQYANQFCALIKLPAKPSVTLQKDLEDLFAKRISFASAISNTDFGLMVRRRYKVYWEDLLALFSHAEFAL